jgi:hypothetical protein
MGMSMKSPARARESADDMFGCGCCLSRLISRRGPPWYLRSATESDDLVIHDLCLESQNLSASRSPRTRRSAAEPTILVIMIVSTWADGLRCDKAWLRVSC